MGIGGSGGASSIDIRAECAILPGTPPRSSKEWRWLSSRTEFDLLLGLDVCEAVRSSIVDLGRGMVVISNGLGHVLLRGKSGC